MRPDYVVGYGAVMHLQLAADVQPFREAVRYRARGQTSDQRLSAHGKYGSFATCR